MQIINRPDFLEKAEANRIRIEIIEPTRGGIYDRNHNLLVENRPSYTLYAYPWSVKNHKNTITALSKVLSINEEEIRRRIGRRGWFTFQATPVLRDISFQNLAYLETIKADLPGIAFEFTPKRAYPLPEAVHLLGYVGERTEKNGSDQSGRMGLVGKHGLEKVYEKWLGGKPGIRYIEVDVSGKVLGTSKQHHTIPPQDGWDLELNIDGNLQRYAYELMEDRKGGVVAMDPRNGEVLVLLSLPDYDPSLFAGVMPEDKWEELINDPAHPLLNRAVLGLYPPGSTYKMAVLAAAFAEGVANENTSFVCTGGMNIGRRFYGCWNKAGHGTVRWKKAIQQSCDVYFYNIGMELGVEKMAEYVKRFGFNEKTGIDFDVESRGLVPDIKYMDKKYGENGWTRGHTANSSIGQGDVLATPVQLAVFTGAIATGYLTRPRLANRLVSPSGDQVLTIQPEKRELLLSNEIRQKLKIAMKAVVNEERGTAHYLRNPEIIISGKTGTSQNPHGEDHGLFVAFAPYEDPLIVCAVVVEHGEHGSTSAAPVAVKLINSYLGNLAETNVSLGVDGEN